MHEIAINQTKSTTAKSGTPALVLIMEKIRMQNDSRYKVQSELKTICNNLKTMPEPETAKESENNVAEPVGAVEMFNYELAKSQRLNEELERMVHHLSTIA